MSSFNSSAFFIAGTAIAIFGVGLYIWDTRKDKVASAFNKYTSQNTTSYNPVDSTAASNPIISTGGSRRKKNKQNKKTNKRR